MPKSKTTTVSSRKNVKLARSQLQQVVMPKMRTRIVPIPQRRLEDFAAEHDLEMVVRERPRPEGDPGRYYASFHDCDVKDGGMLVGDYGDGATPAEAIRNYAPRISLQRIVIGAYKPTRREIEVPRLSA